MTTNKDSYLAKILIFLNTFVQKEACPNNLAPTTSSTAQLVMGMLGNWLVKIKKFSKTILQDIILGNLRKKITLKVSDIYNEKLIPKVNKLDTFQNVIEISSKKEWGQFVVENNKILGIITDGDLRRYLQKTMIFRILLQKN